MATGTRTDEPEHCSPAYLGEAQQLARNVESASDPGCEEWDLAQYTITIVQEVFRLRSKVAYLEGWKEGVEPFVTKHRPRPPVYRSPADETRQAAEDRLNRT